MPMANPKMFSLPLEMLQYIFTFTTPMDLSNLRLTCKELEASVFDIWAKEYLTIVRVFLLDPARLHRIQTLLNTDHLRPRIKHIELTTDIYEDRKLEMTAVPGKGLSAWQTRQESLYEQSIQRYDALFADGSIEWDTIRSIMEVLAKTDYCTLSLNLLGSAATKGKFRQHYPAMLLELLRMAVATDCQVLSLRAMAEFDFDLQDLTQHVPDFAIRISAGLRIFNYHTVLDSFKNIKGAMYILRHATSLQSLSIEIDSSSFKNAHQNSKCMRFPRILTCAARLDRLINLTLTNTLISLEDMLHILRSCSSKLEDIFLDEVTLVASGLPWLEVMRYMRHSLQLHCFHLNRIVSYDPYENGKARKTLVFIKLGQDNRKTIMLSAEGQEQVKSCLDHAIEHGITYIAQYAWA